MRIEFLGTGGAITTPKPFCDCRVCVQARERGRPYSRSGPSVFVHGPDLLIDTPEEIKDQLNRSGVTAIAAATYSHWHPDHTAGRRVWEMNHDWRNWPPRDLCTNVYLPEQVARDFHDRGIWAHLTYMQDSGWLRAQVVPDGGTFVSNGYFVDPIRLHEDYVYAFLIEGNGQRILVVMDELFGWEPPEVVKDVDVAVVPIGIMDVNPLTGERHMPVDHPSLRNEATFSQTLGIVRQLRAKATIFTHFEEPDGLSHDDHTQLEQKLRSQGLAVTMAHDGLVLTI